MLTVPDVDYRGDSLFSFCGPRCSGSGEVSAASGRRDCERGVGGAVGRVREAVLAHRLARSGTPRVLRENCDRLLTGDAAARVLAARLAQPKLKQLLSIGRFSVDGAPAEAWASIKCFRPIDSGDGPLGQGPVGAAGPEGDGGDYKVRSVAGVRPGGRFRRRAGGAASARSGPRRGAPLRSLAQPREASFSHSNRGLRLARSCGASCAAWFRSSRTAGCGR
jgi:hypothetical protein